MNFASKAEIFQFLRTNMADEVQRCKRISGVKRKKTDPINKKIWKELHPALLASLNAIGATEKWSHKRRLDYNLRLFYIALVVNLESRNRVVAYDYMDFARRIGEKWEGFCKICWDFPVNLDLVRLPSPSFKTVRAELLAKFNALVASGASTNSKEVIREYESAIDLLGNINLTEDAYCAIKAQRYVIDFKSGFGSNEKGNTERLLTVAKIYRLLPEKHKCILAVRSEEAQGNNYLQVLKLSSLWRVYCGQEAYGFIHTLTGFDLAKWIRENISFKRDMEAGVFDHLQREGLTKYLVW